MGVVYCSLVAEIFFLCVKTEILDFKPHVPRFQLLVSPCKFRGAGNNVITAPASSSESYFSFKSSPIMTVGQLLGSILDRALSLLSTIPFGALLFLSVLTVLSLTPFTMFWENRLPVKGRVSTWSTAMHLAKTQLLIPINLF